MSVVDFPSPLDVPVTRLARRRAYGTHLDTGVGWIGPIPSHWAVLPAKRIGYFKAGAGFPDEEQGVRDAELPFYKVADMNLAGNEVFMSAFTNTVSRETARRLRAAVIQPGSIIFAKVGAALLLNKRRITSGACCIDNNVIAFVPRSGVTKYWYYQLLCLDLGRLANPGAVPSINEGQLRQIEFGVPPLDEQGAIVAFLDRETAKIDELVAKKERLIGLLGERSQASLTRAIEGESDSPEVRLGYFADLLPGFAFPSGGFTRDEQDVRLLRGVNVSPGGIRWDDVVRWPLGDASVYSEYQLAEGDIVVGMDRPWVSEGIRVARITAPDSPSLLLQRVARIRARNGLFQDYAYLLLRSPQFKAHFEPILTGVSVPHISPEQILAFRFRLPDAEHQRAICDSLQTEFDRADRLIERVRTGIKTLEEYRKTLITAAVTGQIDVRDFRK